jgi:hypothetical protein
LRAAANTSKMARYCQINAFLPVFRVKAFYFQFCEKSRLNAHAIAFKTIGSGSDSTGGTPRRES